MLPGFVFHVANVLNLDIDILGIDESLFKKKVKKCLYDYEDEEGIKHSKAYSCRVRGIVSKNDKYDPDRKRKESNTLLTLKSIIEDHNGWLHVKIYDIDKHDRLIVSLYDNKYTDIGNIILEDKENFGLFVR